jgi:hypothetical protein
VRVAWLPAHVAAGLRWLCFAVVCAVACWLLTRAVRHAQVVQYVGDTHFKPGTWVGVALELPVGKNDGSVDNVRYFSCAHGFGVFVRPEMVQLASQVRSQLFSHVI